MTDEQVEELKKLLLFEHRHKNYFISLKDGSFYELFNVSLCIEKISMYNFVDDDGKVIVSIPDDNIEKIIATDAIISSETLDSKAVNESKAIKRLSCKETWINVNDRLPPDFEEVMFFYIIEDMYKKDIVCGHRANGIWHICYLYESVPLNDLIKVTHWMPLPQFPNIENKL